MGRVTKFRSMNLLGENPKEEKRRLLNERIKLIRKGKSPIEVKDSQIHKFGKGYLKGTTPYQRQRRKSILLKAGLYKQI